LKLERTWDNLETMSVLYMNIQFSFQETLDLYESVLAISDADSFKDWVKLDDLPDPNDDFDDFMRYLDVTDGALDDESYKELTAFLEIYCSMKGSLFLIFYAGHGEVHFCLNEQNGQLFFWGHSGSASPSYFIPTKAQDQIVDCEVIETGKTWVFVDKIVAFAAASGDICTQRELGKGKREYKLSYTTKVNNEDAFGLILTPLH
jgi:hypothetical protein